MKVAGLAAAVSAAMLGACSYEVQTMSAPQLDVYSNYQEKVPGRWALVVDDSVFKKEIHPEGISCAAHNYPLDLTSSFKDSAVGTFQNLVANVEVLDRAVATDALVAGGYSGEIEIRAEDLRSRLTFDPGFWTTMAESDIELDAGVIVNGANGRLLGTRATGKGEDSSPAGEFCGGSADALSHASETAMKDLIGEIGERFSNAAQIRAAGALPLRAASEPFHSAPPRKMARVEKPIPAPAPVADTLPSEAGNDPTPPPTKMASLEPAPVVAPPPRPVPMQEPHASAAPHLTIADGTAAMARGDYSVALTAWKQPAEQGNPIALNGLGFMYERGYGVAKDSKRAMQLYEKAAAQGSYQAGINLGGIYESGEGVKSDPVLAYAWYSIAVAASAGDSALAQTRLDGVAKGMSEGDVSKAKDLAEKCEKSNFAECGD